MVQHDVLGIELRAPLDVPLDLSCANARMTRVLVVEDDDSISDVVVTFLTGRGLSVVRAATVAQANERLAGDTFDVAIIDVTLPDGSATDVLAQMQVLGADPHVIAVSGFGSESDRIEVLESGADDFLVKPFSLRELAARIAAVARRRAGARRVLSYDAFELDIDTRTLRLHDVGVRLTPGEFDLLAFLAARPRHVFTHAELAVPLRRSADDPSHARIIASYVRRLRGKLEADPSNPQVLRTVRGVGYQFFPPPRPNLCPWWSTSRRSSSTRTAMPST